MCNSCYCSAVQCSVHQQTSNIHYWSNTDYVRHRNSIQPHSSHIYGDVDWFCLIASRTIFSSQILYHMHIALHNYCKNNPFQWFLFHFFDSFSIASAFTDIEMGNSEMHIHHLTIVYNFKCISMQNVCFSFDRFLYLCRSHKVAGDAFCSFVS